MTEIFVEKFRGLVPLYLQEAWQEADGIAVSDLDDVFTEMKITVPQALREFLHAVGNSEDLMEAYYYFWDPEELEIEDGYLLFMEDEEEAYTWGMRADQADVPDPIVWRRNNATGEWINEEGTFSEFVFDMLDWVFNEVDEDD